MRFVRNSGRHKLKELNFSLIFNAFRPASGSEYFFSFFWKRGLTNLLGGVILTKLSPQGRLERAGGRRSGRDPVYLVN